MGGLQPPTVRLDRGSCLIDFGDPDRKEAAQDAAGLLKTRRGLRLRAKNDSTVGWNGYVALKAISRLIGNQLGQLRAVLSNPVALLVACLHGIARQHDWAVGGPETLVRTIAGRRSRTSPSPADMKTLAKSIQELFQARLVGLIVGPHPSTDAGARHGEHDVVPATGFLRSMCAKLYS